MVYISEISTTAPAKGTNATKDKVFALLDKLHIPYQRVENDVVETMEECEEIDKALGTEVRKSIFLCNQKKTSFFLVVMPAGKQLDTSALEKKLGGGASVFCLGRDDGETSGREAGIRLCHGTCQR